MNKPMSKCWFSLLLLGALGCASDISHENTPCAEKSKKTVSLNGELSGKNMLNAYCSGYENWFYRIPDIIAYFLSEQYKGDIIAELYIKQGVKQNPSPEVLKIAEEALKNGSEEIKIRALELFGAMGPAAKESAPTILAIAGKAAPRLQEKAIKTLGQMGRAPGVIPELLKYQKASLVENPDIATAADFALGRLNVSSAVPEMLNHLRNRTLGVRIEAAKALGVFEALPPQAVNGVLVACKDPSPLVRAASLLALGNAGECSKEVLDAIEAGLKDKNIDVQKSAITAVKAQMAARKDIVRQLLKLVGNENFWVSTRARQALELVGFKCVKLLSSIVKEPGFKNEIAVLQILAKTSYPGSQVLVDHVLAHDAYSLTSLIAMRVAPEKALFFEPALVKAITIRGLSLPAIRTAKEFKLYSLDILRAVREAKCNAELGKDSQQEAEKFLKSAHALSPKSSREPVTPKGNGEIKND